VSATPALAVIAPAPDFVLRNPAGQPVRLAALRGRVVLVSFIYTRCSAACPILTAQLGHLAEHLARSGQAAQVQLLSITVDPEHDTAAALQRYAARFGAAWPFLREEPATLGRVLAAYDEWTRRLPNDELDHPARLYLIDRQGRIREIYALGFFEPRQALVDIQTLLREPE
jgi:cytochrome oxidase Cu insertion factor (SCO1/SenC/PrrC family)